MLRRDITPEEFVQAVRNASDNGDDYLSVGEAASLPAVRALFETEEERHTAIRIVNGETEVVEGVSEAAADAFLARPLPTPPAGSEEDLLVNTIKGLRHYVDTFTCPAEFESDTDTIVSEVAALRADLERVTRAIRWACGEGDSDFAETMERATDPEVGRAPFWWRTKLRRLAGLDAARTAGEGRDG